MPAMASSFFNLGSIVARRGARLLARSPFRPAGDAGLAIGTLIGGALQLAVQLPALRRLGYVFRPDFHWRDKGVQGHPAADGAVGHRREHHPGERAGQLGVRLAAGRRADLLADGRVPADAAAAGDLRRRARTVALPLLARMAAAGNMTAFRSELRAACGSPS